MEFEEQPTYFKNSVVSTKPIEVCYNVQTQVNKGETDW